MHYGERNEAAADGLKVRGAVVDEICLYEWRLPDDVAPLEQLVDEIIDGRIDALAVTSQIQIGTFSNRRPVGKARLPTR